MSVLKQGTHPRHQKGQHRGVNVELRGIEPRGTFCLLSKAPNKTFGNKANLPLGLEFQTHDQT